MTTHSTHLKLGIFALVVVCGLAAIALLLGMRHLRRSTTQYITYFDESVQGLDRGAPVKYRGVAVGTVTDIRVADDGAHIAVELGLDPAVARRLLATTDLDELRAQLVTQGITGVRLVDISIVDPTKHPPPALSFVPGKNYIPSQRSLFAGLETGVESIRRRLPALADQFEAVFDKLERMLDAVHDKKIVARLAAAIEHTETTVRAMRDVMREVARAKLPERAAATLATLDATLQRARTAFASAGDATTTSSTELRATLRDLSDAARSVRDLVHEIERAPDMLVKGRTRRRER